ncbi:hypothetical protein GCM10022381_32500 [Leifsonia kafniensis]|uniref:DUF4240 domain-containing protein n=1 Tax=Leifsonia kafniensis TaxID=475957 RepID=A0ABP7KX78_9MICO
MIIEAGYDILELLIHEIDRDDDSRRALWVMCMDQDLHYLSIRRACDVVTEPLESHSTDILKVLESDFRTVTYYVLGHAMPNICAPSDGWLYDTDEQLRNLPELAGYRLLGRVVSDPEGFFSSLPRYSFRDYPSLSDLPRAAVIPGPHEFDCCCLSCEQYEQMLTRNRERYRERAQNQGHAGDDTIPSPE